METEPGRGSLHRQASSRSPAHGSDRGERSGRFCVEFKDQTSTIYWRDSCDCGDRRQCQGFCSEQLDKWSRHVLRRARWEEQVWRENQEFSFGSGEAEMLVSVHHDHVVISEAACVVSVSHKTISSERASSSSVLLTVPGTQ